MLTKTVKSFGLAMGLLACSLPLYAKNNVVVVSLLAVPLLVLAQAQQIVQLIQRQKFQLML